MARQEFKLSNLRNLDFGKLEIAFQNELSRVVEDCEDRPGLKTPREVTIKFYFRPKVEASMGNIDCDHVDMQAVLSSSVPKRSTKIYDMQLVGSRGKKMLAFNPDVPEDAEGETLFDDQERRDDEVKGFGETQ